MKTLALIPAYNEEQHIPSVVHATSPHLPILVVDDGSTDNTIKKAEEAGATVIRQNPNQGKGKALQAGFEWALRQGYEGLIMLDADGQHDPHEIPLFLAEAKKNPADLIIGERNFSQMPFVRRCSNSIGRFLFSWAVGQKVKDNQSGYRYLSRRMMEAMQSSTEEGFQFEVEMIVVAIERSYKLGSVPIRTIYADEKSHIQPWKHLCEFLRIVWQTRKRLRSH